MQKAKMIQVKINIVQKPCLFFSLLLSMFYYLNHSHLQLKARLQAYVINLKNTLNKQVKNLISFSISKLFLFNINKSIRNPPYLLFIQDKLNRASIHFLHHITPPFLALPTIIPNQSISALKSLIMRPILGHRGHLGAILIIIDHCLPSLSFDLVDLLEQVSLFCIFSLPRVRLHETQFAHLLMLHQPTFHTALQVAHLVVTAALGKQLMAHHAFGVFLRLLVALVEMVQREGTTIRGLRHYFNYDQLSFPYPKAQSHPSPLFSPSLIIILFSKGRRQRQQPMLNNPRNKENACFPTPQTRLEERPSLEVEELCLQHAGTLDMVCLTCASKFLCSGCITASAHSGHQVRGVQRARGVITGQFQEWMVRLSSKSEILDIIHTQFENCKSHLSLTAKRYKQQLNGEFAMISTQLEHRLAILQENIDAFIGQSLLEMSGLMEHIRATRKEIQRMLIRYDRESLELFSTQELAAHSHRNRPKIGMLLDQSDIVVLKEKLVQPEWKLTNEVFKDIKNSIDYITITFKQAQPPPNIKNSHLEPKRKSKKELKLIQERDKSESKLKLSSSSQHFFQAPTFTPKHNSREKKVKLKRSPEAALLKKRKKSAKMISMPASPAKEVESTYLITPELSRKKLFKKK